MRKDCTVSDWPCKVCAKDSLGTKFMTHFWVVEDLEGRR